MSYPALSSTTLSAALAGPTATAAAATRLSVASTTGMAAYTASTPATILVIGNEAMVVTNVVNSTTVDVERGQLGSTALPHATSTIVYFGNASSAIGNLSTQSPAVYNLAAPLSTTGIPQFVTVVGSKRMDPNTGYVYMLCDCQAALTNGNWCVIDANGLASGLASTSKGRVGVLVEDVSASDTWSWVMVEGSYASANFTSDVTTACYLKANTDIPDILTSTDGNIIWGASCTTAPSTATTTITGAVGTAYLINPWVSGVAVAFSST